MESFSTPLTYSMDVDFYFNWNCSHIFKACNFCWNKIGTKHFYGRNNTVSIQVVEYLEKQLQNY